MKQVEFVFKIRALHCTPLEFITGFLAGAFDLKVATEETLHLLDLRDVLLFILMSADEVMDCLL